MLLGCKLGDKEAVPVRRVRIRHLSFDLSSLCLCGPFAELPLFVFDHYVPSPITPSSQVLARRECWKNCALTYFAHCEQYKLSQSNLALPLSSTLPPSYHFSWRTPSPFPLLSLFRRLSNLPLDPISQ